MHEIRYFSQFPTQKNGVSIMKMDSCEEKKKDMT